MDSSFSLGRGPESFSGESYTVLPSDRKVQLGKVLLWTIMAENGEFYVVRKGDIIGVYKSLSDCQAQAGSSVCNPSISVYRGYCLPKEAEEYLVSHGLNNATYSIHASDVKDDLFGKLDACPYQSMAPGCGRGSTSGRGGRHGATANTDPQQEEIFADELVIDGSAQPGGAQQPTPIPPAGATPATPAMEFDYAAMAAAACQACQQHGGISTPAERAAERWLKLTTQIVALCPQQFLGTIGAIAAQRWIQEIDRVIEILGCTESERIKLAVFRMGGDARSWWDSCIRYYGREALYASSWDDFRQMFEEKFVPTFEKVKLREKYESLTQGSKTVEQYYLEFDHLSYYASSETEEDRVHRFLKGFTPSIREKIGHMQFDTVLKVVVSASAAESVSSSIRSSGDGKRKFDAISRPGSSSSYRKPSQFMARPASTGYQGFRQGAAWFDRNCRNGGIQGHRMTECRKLGGGAQRSAIGGAQGRGAPFPRGQQQHRPAFRSAGQANAPQQPRLVQQRAQGATTPAGGRVFALRGEQYQQDQLEPYSTDEQSHLDEQFRYFQQFLEYQQDQQDEFDQLDHSEPSFVHEPQQPVSSKEKLSDKYSPPKRLQEVAGTSGYRVAVPQAKHLKLENSDEPQAISSNCRLCILKFDGASKGNPGPAGAGAVLYAEDGSLVCRLREGVGIATNNVAEYRGVILGLKYALKKGFGHIRVLGDSKLVCMQIQGLWKIKNQNMADLCKVAKEFKDKFLSFQIDHIDRELNAEADVQANLGVNLRDGQVQEVGC